jgi:hypothetical protein
MSYSIITVSAISGISTNFERAAERLSDLVNELIGQGWKPMGGVAVGQTQNTHEPFLFQAIVRT